MTFQTFFKIPIGNAKNIKGNMKKFLLLNGVSVSSQFGYTCCKFVGPIMCVTCGACSKVVPHLLLHCFLQNLYFGNFLVCNPRQFLMISFHGLVKVNRLNFYGSPQPITFHFQYIWLECNSPIFKQGFFGTRLYLVFGFYLL